MAGSRLDRLLASFRIPPATWPTATFGRYRRVSLTQITLKFTATELQILTGLVADQLFRKEFIDSRLPGFKSNAPELNVGKQLVERMRTASGTLGARRQPSASTSSRAPAP